MNLLRFGATRFVMKSSYPMGMTPMRLASSKAGQPLPYHEQNPDELFKNLMEQGYYGKKSKSNSDSDSNSKPSESPLYRVVSFDVASAVNLRRSFNELCGQEIEEVLGQWGESGYRLVSTTPINGYEGTKYLVCVLKRGF